jgi:hypothetical protein
MPLSLPKLIKDGRIAPWDRIRDEFRDRIKRDEVYTEAPYELINAADVLLVRFGREKCLEHPFAVGGLHDVSNLG